MMRRMLALVLVLALTTALVGARALSPGTLRRGSRGPEVTRLQEALQQLGYYRMAVDGVYGKGTIAAVKAFQARSGLKADGLAGARTQAALYADDAPMTEYAQVTPEPAQAAPAAAETGADTATATDTRPAAVSVSAVANMMCIITISPVSSNLTSGDCNIYTLP